MSHLPGYGASRMAGVEIQPKVAWRLGIRNPSGQYEEQPMSPRGYDPRTYRQMD